MTDEEKVSAGKRFSGDMRRIREDRGHSIDEIHRETRIAETLIESFEQGGLYDHPTFNEVYLRSFVRAYAESIDLSPEAALSALESALEGTYDHELADRYLETSSSGVGDSSAESGEEPDSDDSGEEGERSSAGPPTAGGPEGRGGIVGPPRAVGEDSPDLSQDKEGEGQDPEQEELESPEEPSVEKEPTDGDDRGEGTEAEEPSGFGDGAESEREVPSWMDSEEEQEETSSAKPTGSSPAAGAPPEQPSASDAPAGAGGAGGTGIVGEPTAMGDDASKGPPHGSGSSPKSAPASAQAPPTSAGDSGFFQGDQRKLIFRAIGILVVVAVVVGLLFVYFSGSESANEVSSSAAGVAEQTVADTGATQNEAEETSSDTATTVSQPPPADVTLGEVLHVTLLATDDVSEIRIQRNGDLRRPYWIESGEAAVFPFRRRIDLENELEDVELYVEGYSYPLSSQVQGGELVLTRSDVEAFVDTLRGEPASLSVAPDTIPVGEPSE